MQISIEPLAVPLSSPYRYYLDSLTELPYAQVVVRDARGRTGTGEIACALDVTGESQATAESVTDQLARVLIREEPETLGDISTILSQLDLVLTGHTALKCGIEQALTGYVAGKQQTPAATLIGACARELAPLQCAVPYLANLDEYEERFRSILATDPAYIKLKIGADTQLEAAAIKRLRHLSGMVGISVDANQAFATAREACAFLDEVAPAELAWAEQLTPKHDLNTWHALRRMSSAPLMADESIHSLLDARYFLEHELVDVINIKTAKSGGIEHARAIAAEAARHSVPVMLGSMLHSEMGYHYNLAFSMSQPFIALDMASYFTLAAYTMPPLIDNRTLTVTDHVLYD